VVIDGLYLVEAAGTASLCPKFLTMVLCIIRRSSSSHNERGIYVVNFAQFAK